MATLDYKAPIVPGGNFTWAEYARLRAWNTLLVPTAQQMKSAIFLFSNIQTLIREPLGKPIEISSGARSPEYVRYLRSIRIPAAENGAHNTWEGVDLEPPVGMPNKQFWQFCARVWPGRMELLNYTPSWVHLDTRQWGKRLRFHP
jgi:hypothetical protein